MFSTGSEYAGAGISYGGETLSPLFSRGTKLADQVLTPIALSFVQIVFSNVFKPILYVGRVRWELSELTGPSPREISETVDGLPIHRPPRVPGGPGAATADQGISGGDCQK